MEGGWPSKREAEHRFYACPEIAFAERTSFWGSPYLLVGSGICEDPGGRAELPLRKLVTPGVDGSQRYICIESRGARPPCR
jgi:hypothetical protein